MTQEEIIELGKQAGIKGFEYYELASKKEKEATTTFVNLIVAKEQKKWQDQMAVEIHEAVLEEREACAKVCETRLGPTATEYYGETYAEAIRARGEA